MVTTSSLSTSGLTLSDPQCPSPALFPQPLSPQLRTRELHLLSEEALLALSDKPRPALVPPSPIQAPTSVLPTVPLQDLALLPTLEPALLLLTALQEDTPLSRLMTRTSLSAPSENRFNLRTSSRTPRTDSPSSPTSMSLMPSTSSTDTTSALSPPPSSATLSPPTASTP